jgi:hypothetical protein
VDPGEQMREKNKQQNLDTPTRLLLLPWASCTTILYHSQPQCTPTRNLA